MTARARALALCLTLSTVACAGASGPDQVRDPDPAQPVNRAFFGFNEGIDRYFLGPVADGWSFITPEVFRRRLGKALTNLEFPARFVSNLGQGEVQQAGSEVGRFALNTTVGLLGFFDPAAGIGLPKSDEDIGQMFGRWGVPPGPYLVIPLLGPSSPRDFFGGLVDGVLDLLPGVGQPIKIVNTRALFDRDIEQARAAALDYYVFVRDAYIQRRRAQVRNQIDDSLLPEPDAQDDDLYALPEDDLYEAPEDDAYEETYDEAENAEAGRDESGAGLEGAPGPGGDASDEPEAGDAAAGDAPEAAPAR